MDHIAALFLVSQETSAQLSRVAAPFTFLPMEQQVPFSPYPLQYLSFVFFNNGLSDQCEAASCCGFDLHFSDTDGDHLFMCLLFVCVFFREMSPQVFCPFLDCTVFLILSYLSSLYILETNPFMVALYANIFSLSIGFLFILLMVSISKS